ncbi:uncharacterized protein LOC118755951 [Rhagoletis pomonella]|uniref:uncharacterized protein LOC118755951 n=1 Tax=Rhagoletis pomonella TaxID=28610 RepID=UPI00177F5EB8|nr:uncharacterized protein LOC118755951 [Rhagoletis pomonella]
MVASERLQLKGAIASQRQACQQARSSSPSTAQRQACQQERYLQSPAEPHLQGHYSSALTERLSSAPPTAQHQAHPQERYPSSSLAPRQERYPAPPTAQHQAHPQERYPSPSAAHDRRTEGSSAPFNGVNRALPTRIEATPLPPNGPITGQEAVTQPLN